MPSWTTFGPLLLAVGVPYVAIGLFGRYSGIGRGLAAATCLVCASRYIWWRWTVSLPLHQQLWQQAWTWLFLGVETATVISSMLVCVFMSRSSSRSAQVDARAGSALLKSPVDVLIATFNEDLAILERTIVGALGIDHPNLRVWVLDDAARPHVRALAEELGALYSFRIRGEHAKAGNVNEGLRLATTTGRRPDFILLLDADFVPNRRILRRTLPLFEDADIGIVQTPQHFFNPDPIQSNLLSTSAWPDEQRFFFNYLLVSKDAWGAAFCCGTSAVLRVAALEACGGMATETVTEDMLTTFRMLEHGYRTIFLNEPLSLGLAPESLKEYVSQRARWCLGAIQQIYTRWGFAGAAPVGFVNRLSALDGVLYWCANFAFKLMIISAPLVYWWTGTSVINSSTTDMIIWLGPHVLSGMVFMGCLGGNTVFPIMTDVTQLLSAVAIVRTIGVGLIKPWGHPFRVTTKGVSTDRVTVQWAMLAPFAFVAIGTAAGMMLNTGPFNQFSAAAGYEFNVFWSLFNIMLLCICIAVCVEPPKRRRDDRFRADEPARAAFAGSGLYGDCTVVDISLGGASLVRSGGWPDIRTSGHLHLHDISAPLPFTTVRVVEDGSLAVHFENDALLRRALILKLFTGDYDNEVPKVRILATLSGMVRTVFQ